MFETRRPMEYSAVIPVFNSAEIIETTTQRCLEFFERRGSTYEILLIDDGSEDASWTKLMALAQRFPHVVAVRLLRNYGQHSAVHCGLELSRGEAVVVLDDDLQNPPEQIEHLIAAANEGADVVFGRYARKRHAFSRRVASWLTDRINTQVFRKPPELVLSNFKLIRREVVRRILSHRTLYPYINGLAVLYAQRAANVLVEHHARAAGASTYTFRRLVSVLARILFAYSAFPLRLVSALGLGVSLLAFGIAAAVLLKALVVDTRVPGWASITVLVSFFGGVITLMLGVIGEYVVRLVLQVTRNEPYHVITVKRHDGHG